jgi:hypothetical protein
MRIIPITDGIEMNGNPPSAMYRYKVVDVFDVETATSFALVSTAALVATPYGVLYRNDVRMRRAAYNQWMVEVPYGTRQSEVGEWTWDFDTTGGTVHITQAREEVARYPADTAPDQQGVIAVDGDEVRGAEIVIPAMKINVTYRHPLGIVTLAFAKALSEITGTVNSTPFLSYSPGQVLFLGARGSDGTSADASVSYQFAMAKNETGVTIGSVGGIAKKAWDVAWVRYRDTVTVADGEDRPTRIPQYVYVDRVYEEIDMAAALGFGA